MQTRAIWKNEFGTWMAESDDQAAVLGGVCDLLDCFEEHGVEFVRTEQCYTEEFADFLWSNRRLKEQCGDDLILLSKCIQKAEEIDEEMYDSEILLIMEDKREDALLMMVDAPRSCRQSVSNEKEYYECREFQMKYLVREDEFYDCANVSFRHLYFSENVGDSIKTLTVPFVRIQELIGDHLSFLDGEYTLLCDSQKKGYVKLAEEFDGRTGIECSAMSGRSSVNDLRFSFIDDEGKKQEVLCELHTKLKYKGMDRKNQNRIYFHPPITGVAGGRVLIAYIGKHL